MQYVIEFNHTDEPVGIMEGDSPAEAMESYRQWVAEENNATAQGGWTDGVFYMTVSSDRGTETFGFRAYPAAEADPFTRMRVGLPG